VTSGGSRPRSKAQHGGDREGLGRTSRSASPRARARSAPGHQGAPHRDQSGRSRPSSATLLRFGVRRESGPRAAPRSWEPDGGVSRSYSEHVQGELTASLVVLQQGNVKLPRRPRRAQSHQEGTAVRVRRATAARLDRQRSESQAAARSTRGSSKLESPHRLRRARVWHRRRG
jgi:hypothetical protein